MELRLHRLPVADCRSSCGPEAFHGCVSETKAVPGSGDRFEYTPNFSNCRGLPRVCVRSSSRKRPQEVFLMSLAM